MKTDVCSEAVNPTAALSHGQIASCFGRRSGEGRAPDDTAVIWSLNHSPVRLLLASEGQQIVRFHADNEGNTEKAVC